MQSPTQNTAKA